MKEEDKFTKVVINGKPIIIGGIGKMFYQDGFPIPLAVTKFLEKGFEVSVLHIADELLKNQWKPETVYTRLEHEFKDFIVGDVPMFVDFNVLRSFCFSSYEDQRDMIFKGLFNSKNDATAFFNNLMERA